MMNKTVLRSFEQFLFITLFTIIPIACSSSGPSGPSSITLIESNSGSTIEVSLGKTLEILLDGNPSTGYMWEVDSVDPAILQQAGELEFRPDSDAIGSGGKVIMRFTTLSVGQTTLRLVYHRPWEEDVPSLKTFEVFVIVT